MFKLVVVGGPNPNATYVLQEGENVLGRASNCTVVLKSTQISKRHCQVWVEGKKVTARDLKSSNGTFVNGSLIKEKKLNAGDRLVVGEYVFELVRVDEARVDSVSTLSMPQLDLSMGTSSTAAGAGSTASTGSGPSLSSTPGSLSSQVPLTPLEKAKAFFEQNIANFFYNVNEKQEWRSIVAILFVALVVCSSLLSVYPILDSVSEKLTQESVGRALLIARQMVDRNARYIYDRMESKVDVGFAEREPGVLSAYILDLDGRILAPSRRLNQYLEESQEASFSAKARTLFNANENLERKTNLFGDMVAAAVPLRIFSASAGKNVTVALGVVFFDRRFIVFDPGSEALLFLQALILSGLVAVLVFFTVYRLTIRPFLELNNDVDQVLKGNAESVNRRYKFEEVDPLFDVINAALQRVQGGGIGSAGASGESVSIEDVVGLLRVLGEQVSGAGWIVFGMDRRIQLLSPMMEQVTGIRSDGARGQEFASVARDQAFLSFVEDFFARAGGIDQDPVSDELEFSGVNYRLSMIAFGAPGVVRAYILIARSVGGEGGTS